MHRTSLLLLSLLIASGCASPPSLDAPAHAVIGVHDEQLEARYWIERAPRATQLVLDRAAIAAHNDRLQRSDPSLHDLEALPTQLARVQIQGWIEDLSQRPTRTLYDERGTAIPEATLDALVAALDVAAIPQQRPTAYGMVVRRADLRTFPTRLRVFHTPGDTDIDRFQENALFPGTPVVIAHESRDGQWWFVVSPLYAAWIEKQYVAQGSAQEVFAYGRKTPYLIVTGSTARTVFTREQPQVSELQLDMGVRVPVLADWPADRTVNGQHPYAAHVVELPLRGDDGSLRFAPALIPRTADVARDYLPLDRAALLRQSFKFLGERYGWGHSYNARDCSGFVSEVYRSFDVQLPRNTRDQGTSPALDRIELTASDSHEMRLALLRELQIGDLVYIPGHVMMVIGHRDGVPYVIHDTTGIAYRDAQGAIKRVDLNGVSVTPLTPLVLGDGQPTIDRIYSIVRIRP